MPRGEFLDRDEHRAGLLGSVTWSPVGHLASGRYQSCFTRRRPPHRDDCVLGSRIRTSVLSRTGSLSTSPKDWPPPDNAVSVPWMDARYGDPPPSAVTGSHTFRSCLDACLARLLPRPARKERLRGDQPGGISRGDQPGGTSPKPPTRSSRTAAGEKRHGGPQAAVGPSERRHGSCTASPKSRSERGRTCGP